MVLKVLLDANVLLPQQQRNIILQIALKHRIELHWTKLIVEEWLRNVEPAVRGNCEQRTLPLMARYFPRAELPAMPATPYGSTDAKDRHVAAAAVHVAPSVLVTWNIRDFDRSALAGHGVTLQTPDQLISDLYDQFPDLTYEAALEGKANLSRSAPSWDDFIALLAGNGLTAFVKRIDGHHKRLSHECEDEERSEEEEDRTDYTGCGGPP